MTNNEPKKSDENIGSFYIGRRPPAAPERVLPKGGLTVVALVAFVAIIWYAYPQGEEKYEGLDVPVVVADKAAYKFTPDDPGGMVVRHQDSTVFDPLEKKTAKTVERLLPATEEPIDKDAALKSNKPATQADAKSDLKLDMQKLDAGTEKFVSKTEAPDVAVVKPVAKPVEKTVAAKAVEKAPTPETAEAKTPAPTTSKQTAAATGNVYIQLGSYRSTDGAAVDWKKLKQKHPQLLSGLDMRTQRVDLGEKGVFNRLQAGKVSEARAKEICEVLKSANSGGCIVVR